MCYTTWSATTGLMTRDVIRYISWDQRYYTVSALRDMAKYQVWWDKIYRGKCDKWWATKGGVIRDFLRSDMHCSTIFGDLYGDMQDIVRQEIWWDTRCCLERDMVRYMLTDDMCYDMKYSVIRDVVRYETWGEWTRDKSWDMVHMMQEDVTQWDTSMGFRNCR